MIFNKFFFYNFLTISFVYILDRVSKIYIINLDKTNFGTDIFVSKYLNINLIWNKGVSFGFFAFDKHYSYNLLSLFILFIIIILIYMTIKNHGLKRIFFLIIIGGAIGNFHDRIQYKAVPDFIDFHVGDFHWFIFNVSDIFITIGVIGIIILELTNNKKIDNEKV